MTTIKNEEKYDSWEYILLTLIFISVIICLITPLVLMSSTFFPFIVGKALIARISIEFAFVFWLILAYRIPKYRPNSSIITYLFLVWILITIVTGFMGVSFQRSLWSSLERMQGIIDLLHWFVFILIVISIFKTGTSYKQDWLMFKRNKSYILDTSKMFNWRILISINAAVSLYMGLMSLDLYYSVNIFPSYDAFNYIDQSRRIMGTLGNPTFVGAYMLVNIFLVAGLLAQSIIDKKYLEKTVLVGSGNMLKKKRKSLKPNIPNFLLFRSFWIAILIVNCWVLILTETRAAIFIGLPVGLVIILIGFSLWYKDTILSNISKFILALIIILVFVIVFSRDTAAFNYLAESNDLINRVKNIDLDDPSIKGRISSHAAGFRAVLDKPIFGYGPENYIVAWGEHYIFDKESYEVYDQAHNKILEEMSTKGVMGLFSYSILWVMMFWAVYNKSKDSNEREQVFNLFLLGALGSYFAQNIFLFDTPSTVLQFSILVALVIFVEKNSLDNLLKINLNKYFDNFKAYLPNMDKLYVVFISIFCVLTIVIGVWMNSKIYLSARILLDAHMLEPDWEEKIAKYEDSINMFTPMANYPRKFSFNQIEKNLITMNKSDFKLVMTYVDAESEKVLKSEPRNWAIFGDLTRVYREASRVNSAYEKEYYKYYNLISTIAPETLEAKQIVHFEENNRN